MGAMGGSAGASGRYRESMSMMEPSAKPKLANLGDKVADGMASLVGWVLILAMVFTAVAFAAFLFTGKDITQ